MCTQQEKNDISHVTTCLESDCIVPEIMSEIALCEPTSVAGLDDATSTSTEDEDDVRFFLITHTHTHTHTHCYVISQVFSDSAISSQQTVPNKRRRLLQPLTLTAEVIIITLPPPPSPFSL